MRVRARPRKGPHHHDGETLHGHEHNRIGPAQPAGPGFGPFLIRVCSRPRVPGDPPSGRSALRRASALGCGDRCRRGTMSSVEPGDARTVTSAATSAATPACRPARRAGEDVRRGARGGRRRPRDRRGRVLLAARPLRQRQDHRAAHDRRLRAADRRRRSAAGPGRHPHTAVRPRPEHGLPGLRAVPPPHRAAERRVRPQGQRRQARRTAPPRSARCSSRCASRTTATASQTS